MSTVRPLSARVTFFSSRLMLNTDLLEMSSLPCSSCPRTGSRRGPSKGSSYLINLTLDRSGGVKVEGDRGEAKQTRNMGNKTTEKCRSTGGGIDKPVQKQKAMLEIGEIGEYKRRSRMEKWKERETSLRYTEKKNWDETLQAENREVKENRLQRKLGHILNCSKPTLFSFSFQIWKHNTKLKPNIKDNMETAEAEPLKRQSAWWCNHSGKLSQAVRTNLMKDGWWLLC